MEAVPLLSYLGDYVAGKLPYWYPEGPFTPGTNGVGVVEAVGGDVYRLAPGQRVAVNPYLVADENVDDPAQVLIGLTGISPDSGPMLSAWRNGTLAERVLMPASTLVPLDGLQDAAAPERLAALGKFVVPLGGRLAAGETLIVNGATGYFGSAAVLLGLALGAGRVVAAGRSRAALKAAAGGGAHLSCDMVGRAEDPNATLAAMRALRRGGRLVLMGSMTVPLPLAYAEVMLNNWEVIGTFMYGRAAYPRLVALVRAGLLDLDRARVRTFPLAELPAAMEAAARMRGLDCTVVQTGGRS